MSQKVVKEVVVYEEEEEDDDEGSGWEVETSSDESEEEVIVVTRRIITKAPPPKADTISTSETKVETKKEVVAEMEKEVKSKIQEKVAIDDAKVSKETKVEKKSSEEKEIKANDAIITNGVLSSEEKTKIMNGETKKVEEKAVKSTETPTQSAKTQSKTEEMSSPPIEKALKIDESHERMEDKPPKNPISTVPTTAKVTKTKKNDSENNSSSVEKEGDDGSTKKKKKVVKKKKSVDVDDDNASVSSSSEKKVKKVKKKSVDRDSVEIAEESSGKVKTTKKKKDVESDTADDKTEKKKPKKKDVKEGKEGKEGKEKKEVKEGKGGKEGKEEKEGKEGKEVKEEKKVKKEKEAKESEEVVKPTKKKVKDSNDAEVKKKTKVKSNKVEPAVAVELKDSESIDQVINKKVENISDQKAEKINMKSDILEEITTDRESLKTDSVDKKDARNEPVKLSAPKLEATTENGTSLRTEDAIVEVTPKKVEMNEAIDLLDENTKKNLKEKSFEISSKENDESIKKEDIVISSNDVLKEYDIGREKNVTKHDVLTKGEDTCVQTNDILGKKSEVKIDKVVIKEDFDKVDEDILKKSVLPSNNNEDDLKIKQDIKKDNGEVKKSYDVKNGEFEVAKKDGIIEKDKNEANESASKIETEVAKSEQPKVENETIKREASAELTEQKTPINEREDKDYSKLDMDDADFNENIDEWMKSILAKHKINSDFLTSNNSVSNGNVENKDDDISKGQQTKTNVSSTLKEASAKADDNEDQIAYKSSVSSKKKETLETTENDSDEKPVTTSRYDKKPKESDDQTESKSFLNKTYDNSDDEVEAVSRYLAKRCDKDENVTQKKSTSGDKYSGYTKKERPKLYVEEDYEYEEERPRTRGKAKTFVAEVDEDEEADEGFMARFRKEKQGRTASSSREVMHKPRRRDDTEERVKEKTRHVKALVEKQQSVVENFGTACKKITELENMLRECKAEVMEQRSNMENLEDILDAIYKQYESEVTTAMKQLKQQKKPKFDDLKDEIEKVLNDVRVYTKTQPSKSLFSGEGLDDYERVNATSRTSWSGLWDSIGGGPKFKERLNNNEEEYGALKAKRVSFAGEASSVSELMNGDRGSMVEENGRSSSSTDDFISRIRNKYSIPASDSSRKYTSSYNTPSSRNSFSDFSLLDSKYRRSITEASDVGRSKFKPTKNTDDLISKYTSKSKYEDTPSYSSPRSYLSTSSYSPQKPSGYSFLSKTSTQPSYQSKFLRAAQTYM